MGLFDTISGFLGGNTNGVETKTKKKVGKSSAVNIDSSFIEDYKSYLNDNDIFVSYEIEDRLRNLSKRANEPMKLAVSGLFSSGKSTFLNAMLSDDILPSGNLPITSKITYLRYGKESQLEITYTDGREEFAAVDNIAKYVSQQSAQQIKNIEYITLYYPKDILKNIVFVDTPGFNSPNKMDDKTTEDIMENVDGIIWLTMISNAGKKSEIDILEKYFKQYSQKSICIVNHKDEIDDDDEVEEFIEELKEDNNFSKYFADIIPISALQALESRKKDQDESMLKLVRDFSNLIESKLESHIQNDTILEASQSIINDDFVAFTKKHNEIKSSDPQENKSLLKKSNIQDVFLYIEKDIIPQASTALSFSLQKEMKSINSEVSEHYKYLAGAIEELEVILKEFSTYQESAIIDLNAIATRNGTKVLRDVENILDSVTDIVYNSFSLVKNGEFFPDGEETFWSNTPTGAWVDVYIFDNEYIWNQLADDNDQFQTATSRLESAFEKMQEELVSGVEEIETTLESKIKTWKNSYSTLQEASPENIQLHEFALSSFDMFVNDFENNAIIFVKDLEMYSTLISQTYTHFMNMVNTSFRVAFYFNKTDTRPSKGEIKNLLNDVTNLEHTQSMITGKDSLYISLLDGMKEVLSEISDNKMNDVLPYKEEWMNKNELLNEYMKQLEKRIT